MMTALLFAIESLTNGRVAGVLGSVQGWRPLALDLPQVE
jgi:hypothetical protein